MFGKYAVTVEQTNLDLKRVLLLDGAPRRE